MKTRRTWKKRGLGLLVFLLLLYILGGGEYNLYNLLQAKQTERQLRTRLLESEEERRMLLEETRKLQDDPSYIEKVAREQYNMGRPGETIYISENGENE